MTTNEKTAETPGAAPLKDRLPGNLPKLAAFMKIQGILDDTPLEILRRFENGQSNPTYLLGAGDRRFVLRKQPDGPLLPKAHDVIREYGIIRELGRTGFPVARALTGSDDREIIGTAFYLMDFVEGSVFSDAGLATLNRGDRAEIYSGMITTLARLHQIDTAALAPAGITPREDFIGRQIKIWRGAYIASQTTADDRIEAVAEKLLEQRPPVELSAIVHGDYRIENLIFSGTKPAAVLDWELCTIGDPRADLAYCCLWHHFPSHILEGVADLDLKDLGIPDERALLDLYAAQGGPDPHATHRYFLSFAFYRLAAILQGVYKRALDGNAASPDAIRRGQIAEYCLERAAEFIA